MVRRAGIGRWAVWVLGVAVAASPACGGGAEEEAAPAAERQAQTAQPANTPITIAGCLKAGESGDTFVLAVAQTAGAGDTATYHLTGNAGVNLRDHVGQSVEVNGTVRAEQELASRAPAQPAEGATGTSGTPTVQTRTEIEIKQLDVASVRPLGGTCAN
jgi:hypothetical protein